MTNKQNSVAINEELLVGSWHAASELPWLDSDQAAVLAAHIFQKIYGVTADKETCDFLDTEGECQMWSGTVNDVAWTMIGDEEENFKISFAGK